MFILTRIDFTGTTQEVFIQEWKSLILLQLAPRRIRFMDPPWFQPDCCSWHYFLYINCEGLASAMQLLSY